MIDRAVFLSLMTWNWQQPDWPAFTWERNRLKQAEEAFLVGSGAFEGAIRHLAGDDHRQLTIEAMSTEALTTSKIEGEMLDRASVQSSIRREFGLQADQRRAGPAEQGIAQMMVDLYRSFATPLTDDMLFRWHRMLLKGRRGITDIGRYRTGAAAMQVVSAAWIHREFISRRRPPRTCPEQMTQFIDWFNHTAPNSDGSLPAVTRAGIAHLYFESIHPFEDGNGRIGRAISEKALSQSLGQPALTALAATLLIRRKAYYAALEAANKHNEITSWLAWFAGITIEAQRHTAARIDFLIDKTKLLDRLRGPTQ